MIMSVFDAEILIQITLLISLSDFPPLSIDKINIFSLTTGIWERYFSDKLCAIPIEEVPVQSMLRDGASFRRLTSLTGLKYLHQPSNFVLNILTLTCNV